MATKRKSVVAPVRQQFFTTSPVEDFNTIYESLSAMENDGFLMDGLTVTVLEVVGEKQVTVPETKYILKDIS